LHKTVEDVCDVTLSVYPHRASLKNMPGDHRGRAYFSSSPGVDIHSEKHHKHHHHTQHQHRKKTVEDANIALFA
jgi:hypothetical protein